MVDGFIILDDLCPLIVEGFRLDLLGFDIVLELLADADRVFFALYGFVQADRLMVMILLNCRAELRAVLWELNKDILVHLVELLNCFWAENFLFFLIVAEQLLDHL